LTSKRFLALHYANNDRHNGALSSRMEKRKKNADDTVQKSIDGTKQIKRKQEACMISWVS
ncbi:hypothetical protein T10_5480, partial [Trichinella papuae]